MDSSEKKKYWTDQIKAMLGPCMITFAIPLTIPGMTITLVAFSEDTTFETYGALHIVGILCLAAAVILLILGCTLRVLWKPMIGPELAMHITPLQSVASLRERKSETLKEKEKLKEVYSGRSSNPEGRSSRSGDRVHGGTTPRSTVAAERQGTDNPARGMVERQEKHHRERRRSRSKDKGYRRSSSDSGRKTRTAAVPQDSNSSGSESESAMCINKHRRGGSVDSSGRTGRKYSNDEIADEKYPLEKSHLQKAPVPISGEPGLDEIQQWRQNKSKRRKSLMDTGIVNAASDCDDDVMSRPLPRLKLNEKSLTSSVENGNSTGDENNSGQSARSPHQRLLENDDSLLEKKRRKKKKRVSKNKSGSANPKPDYVLPPVLRARQQSKSDDENLNEAPLQGSASSDSLNSIMSADSVLAQYTSRDPPV